MFNRNAINKNDGQAAQTSAPGAFVSRERLWIGAFAVGFGVVWALAPAAFSSLLIAGVLSLVLHVRAGMSVSRMDRVRSFSGEPVLADTMTAGSLAATLLWLALSIAHAVVPAGMLVLNSAFAFAIFLLLIVAESVISFAVLQLVKKHELSAELVLAQALDAKFGGLAGRIAR